MRKKLIWAMVALLLLLFYYEMVFRTKTVTYMGESKDWYIEINAKLAGLNGSYNVKVQNKAKKPIEYANINIYPRSYQIDFPFFDKNGYLYRECKDNCGFYNKGSKLLLFIVWKEDNESEENMQFIDLRKVPSKR